MPAHPINMGTKEKVIRMVEFIFVHYAPRLYSRAIHALSIHTIMRVWRVAFASRSFNLLGDEGR